MTAHIKIIFFLITFIPFFGHSQEIKQSKNTTTYILVRHSEKDLSDPSNRNPELTKAGKERSENLAEILTDTTIDQVYSTNYARTLQTAEPIAKAKNIKVTHYDPRKLYDEEFQKNTKGKTTVIVGHSNTTPAFVNKIMGQKKYNDLDEKEYGKLFIIKITGDVITDTVLDID